MSGAGLHFPPAAGFRIPLPAVISARQAGIVARLLGDLAGSEIQALDGGSASRAALRET